MSLYRPFLFKNVEVLLITELLGNVGMARIGHPLCCTSYPESMKTLSRWTDCKVNGQPFKFKSRSLPKAVYKYQDRFIEWCTKRYKLHLATTTFVTCLIQEFAMSMEEKIIHLDCRFRHSYLITNK